MEGYWKCHDGLSCIREVWKCDLEADCMDGSDEVDCGEILFKIH